MDRRAFLRRSAVLLAAAGSPGLLAACGRGAAGGIPEGPAQLNATITTWEFLVGDPRPVPILVRTLENVQVEDTELQVYVRTVDGEVLDGPLPTTYEEVPGTGLGLHVAEFAVEQPGQIEVVVVDGDQYGATVVNAVAPEQSEIPVPGKQALAVPTPTVDRPLNFEKLCTQDPACEMHDISLDQALEDGRPVMLMFATPEFCQTATCGPAVGTMDEIRTSGDWPEDLAWIHVEVYSEVSGELKTGKPIRDWGLPSEPWLFSIDGSGDIARRLDGPMIPRMIEEMATDLTA
ncbi:MAG TPA: hypothetical protein VM307_06475 [Egibacteraceae bacterium]|nr:hypothetical protein [Egibacteraceae bacterium]